MFKRSYIGMRSFFAHSTSLVENFNSRDRALVLDQSEKVQSMQGSHTLQLTPPPPASKFALGLTSPRVSPSCWRMGTAAATAVAAALSRDYGPHGAAGGLSRSTPRQADCTTTRPLGSGPTRQSDARASEPILAFAAEALAGSSVVRCWLNSL